MRKIVVLGAKGMLGHELLKAIPDDHQITAWDIDDLDICDLDATIETQLAAMKEFLTEQPLFLPVPEIDPADWQQRSPDVVPPEV